MMPKIHRREHTKQVERIQRRNPADVELAIGEIRFRRDVHAIAVELRVGEGSEQGELSDFAVILPVDLRKPHREGWKLQEQRQERQGIAAVSERKRTRLN